MYSMDLRHLDNALLLKDGSKECDAMRLGMHRKGEINEKTVSFCQDYIDIDIDIDIDINIDIQIQDSI